MNKKLKIGIITAGVIVAPVLLSPLPRFRAPLSTIVEARDGSLLGARIADDGQWRFPSSGKVPEKFEKALLTFEDRYFYLHPGVNPVSMARALAGNIKARRIVSGGSTITMQVARLSGGNKPRTYGEKLIEVAQAFKLEIFRSKREILRMYAGNAPFGGNTVGIDAAARRYTGKPPEELTWAEAAALAVLPNSPALVYPGRNQSRLRERRNMLLRKLHERKYIDSLTLVLSLDEPLPHEPGALPSKAPHLTSMFSLSDKGKRIRTTIDTDLQERATAIINDHQRDLSGNFIFNCAAIIVGVKKGDVLAYVGNSTNEGLPLHGGDVDIIRSERSTGSILKPLLYAAMQQSGELLPNSLVPDIPTRFPGFSPKNFDQSFSGAVPADLALYQSLNIPAVKMLQKYTSERFLDLLRKTGFSSFRKPADHYGLSLILGGGEASLWELAGVYASCSRVLRRYNIEKKYFKGDFHPPLVVAKDTSAQVSDEDPDPPLSAAAIWLTYEALQKVNRPGSETGWQYFAYAPGFAWKTGTSFGFRDAWAIGTTPEYVIAVWAGNADGEGRPGLTGISAAAPILFDLAALLKPSGWFEQPDEEMTLIKVCKSSGFRAGPDCPDTREVYACIDGLRSEPCPYHRVVHLNQSRTRQVSAACATPAEMVNEPWFVMPPAMEYFYRQKHPEYMVLPPFEAGCTDEKTIALMEFIYPTPGIKIFIPRDEKGELTRIVAEVAHRDPSKKIFWHLDEGYSGTTRNIHQAEIVAAPGRHMLTVVDEDGNSIRCGFEIVSP